MLEAVTRTASAPDELYADPRGTLHLIQSLSEEPADLLVVIARRTNSRTHLIPAYQIGLKRKERRYRKFKRLPLSSTSI